jgi:transposase-like protein
MRCPYCQVETRQVKAGFTRARSQRYRCQACGRYYTPDAKESGYGVEKRQQALRLIADGVNFRRAARLVGVNHQTVINWFRAATAQLPPAPQPKRVDVIEMDEVFTFVGRKKSKRSSSRS